MTPTICHIAAILVWLVGGNLLCASHYRRLGQPVAAGLMSLKFPFFSFNGREWLILIILLLVTFAVAMAANVVG
jgi:hypothetical protein